MKVIIVNRFFYPDQSATSRMSTELAEGLAASHTVHVVTSRQRYDQPRAKLSCRDNLGPVVIHRVPGTRFGRGSLVGRSFDYLSFYVSSFFCLLSVAGKNDTIIAETDPPLVSVAAMAAARLKGARLINWVQDLFPEIAEALGVGKSGTAASRALTALRNASLRRAATNVALSRDMARRIHSAAGDVRVQVIHNWADGTRIRPVERSANELRARWGLGDAFVVAYSGNLGRAHEVGTLLGAAERLREDRGVRFLFVGGGYLWPELRRAADEKKLTNIRFEDYQPEERLSESLSAGDLHVISLLPAAEGLVVPSKLYGILAAGRPAVYIGSASSETAEILSDNGCGLTVRPGDAAALAEAVRALAADLDRVRRMGLNARQAFDARFDRAQALAAWRKLIETS